MGSGYYGEPNLGNERSGSSRKGKKNNSDKPKQPQRGLGVAQLERIRLHSQMGCSYLPTNLNPQEDMRVQTAYPSSSFSYTSSSSSSYGLAGHQGIMMGLGDMERPNVIYGDSQPTTTPRWNPGNAVLETPHFAQPGFPGPFLNQQLEKLPRKNRKKEKSDGSSSQNSGSSGGTQEVDLELRLSL